MTWNCCFCLKALNKVKFCFRGRHTNSFKCQLNSYTQKFKNNTNFRLLHWIETILIFIQLQKVMLLSIFFESQWEKEPKLYSKCMMKNH